MKQLGIIIKECKSSFTTQNTKIQTNGDEVQNNFSGLWVKQFKHPHHDNFCITYKFEPTSVQQKQTPD